MKKIIFLLICIFLFLIFLISSIPFKIKIQEVSSSWWKFQSIDTMKYSRDLAREKLGDPSFDLIINQQVKSIADTGATHVAIATPYDEEFYPILSKWVRAARKNKINVWFRGNWSGWEGWFEYDPITREEHISKTEKFILAHRDLFKDGDVFSACPECENGGPGDPRETGDVEEYRKFLISEHEVVKNTFEKINRDVSSEFNSMNGDVAKLIMDKPTTKSLGGIIVVDHYVDKPEKLAEDIDEFAKLSGGKVVLGEFGAPIPDIHGEMTEEQQAEWLDKALVALEDNESLIGLNYWTNTGSSTNLWEEDGQERKSVNVLKKFYKAPLVRGVVMNEIGKPVQGAYIGIDGKYYLSNVDGHFSFPVISENTKYTIEAEGYEDKSEIADKSIAQLIVLKKTNEDVVFKLRKIIAKFINPTLK